MKPSCTPQVACAPVPADGCAPEVLRTPSMDGPVPDVSVVISTFRRSHFLEDLIGHLEAQHLHRSRFEVVLVDNGSADDTWSVLTALVGRTPLRLAAVRLEVNRGPAGARNVGVALARGGVVAFTDDDCLPTPGWLDALWAAFEAGADLVQGLTRPDPTGRRTSAWDRSVEILERSGLYETCNVAYRRAHLERSGGFDETGLVIGHRAARPFGEDAELGWRVHDLGATFAFAPTAEVHHRWHPGTFEGWISERRQLGNFAALARRSRGVSSLLWHRVFLTPTTAAFDLGVTSVILAAALRRPWLLLGMSPWVLRRWPDARSRTGRSPVVRLAQVGLGDLVGFAALVEGSLRHRRLVL